jgi:hypothetical protein
MHQYWFIGRKVVKKWNAKGIVLPLEIFQEAIRDITCLSKEGVTGMLASVGACQRLCRFRQNFPQTTSVHSISGILGSTIQLFAQ